MHFHGGRGFGILEVFIGVALIWNCARGLSRREDMYDQQSTLYTTLALWFGIVLGLALLGHVAWMMHLLFSSF